MPEHRDATTPGGFMDDPAYRFELEKLDSLVADYVKAREANDGSATMLVLGMMTAQLAALYKLSPPAGLIDVPGLFRRDDND